MSSKYKISDHQALHFITFAVAWVDALSRPIYKDIIVDSLCYCIKSKGLVLYAYVIMSNHIHLIASAKEAYNLSDILIDLKKHTSKTILSAIENNIQESRKNWMLWIFKKAGEKNSNNKNHQFWQQDNRPIMLSERLVHEPEHYIYSSAVDYAGGKGLIELVMIG